MATGTPVGTLLRVALDTDDSRMSGAPGWVGTETFDIDGIIADHAEINTPQDYQQLILSLLTDRFGLKFHRVQQPGSVFELQLVKPGKLGPLLKPSAPDSQANISTNSNRAKTTLRVSRGTMQDIAHVLQRQSGRPVEDRTGLQGTFDFAIEWAPEQSQDATEPSLFTVLKEQLGLKLQPAKGDVERVVIDQLEKPSEN